MKTTTFTFRLSPDLESEIQTESGKQGISSSKLIRKAIRNHLKNRN